MFSTFGFRVVVIGAAVLLGLGRQCVLAQTFQLVQSHSGISFLNNWTFYSGIDTNNTGNVLYQTQEQAQQEKLTFFNSAGNFVIKVDNTTDGTNDPTFGRPSVKILTSYTISSGNLVLFDAVHLPYGCSVWPAFWTQGPVWPDDGEIDIIEGVNMQAQNRIALHTLDGCTHPDASVSSSLETGTLISTDCFNQTDFDEGCLVQVPNNSYGASFAQNGGGVYALNWNDSGLFFYFFERGSIPADLPSGSPNPNSWGLPTAAYPTSSCASTFFTPQTLILETTICGNFAGTPSVFQQTCSGNCVDLVQTPSNYDEAYFEISYMKVFEQTNETAPPPPTVSNGAAVSPSTSGSTGTSASSAATTSVGTVNKGSSSGATRLSGSVFSFLLSVLVAGVLSMQL
ncbi:hypothetical protein EW145_g5650 [Phellinidium pouzarii]|uniref:GH16 domain-containing protein n=1 Tax=Phellinidium pouzarii TaxID=167371 RepID=A0A4S4KZ91_9AGAM|nr:hypothetical protein EW145_g5650 [Phellinidium pouzarii]